MRVHMINLQEPPISPFVQQLLEELPMLQMTSHDFSSVMLQLRFVINRHPLITRTYISNISTYLRNNVERSVKILESVQCLGIIYPELSLPFRQSVSRLLEQKYWCVELSGELAKLRAVNQSLEEPFLFLVCKIAEWHMKEVESKQYQQSSFFQLAFLLDFLYSVTKIEFESDLAIQGADISRFLLTIFRMLSEDENQAASFMCDENNSHKISLAIFYFLTNYSIQSVEYAQVVFVATDKLISFIRYYGHSFEDLIFQQILKIIRNSGRSNDLSQDKLKGMKNAIISILAITWSFDRQFQWTWRCKIMWDLLNVESQSQIQLLQQLSSTSKDLARCLDLL